MHYKVKVHFEDDQIMEFDNWNWIPNFNQTFYLK